MDNTLNEIKNILAEMDMPVETTNYYFEMHMCPATGSEEKAILKYKISNEVDDEIIKFGACSKCKQVFFHKDFE